MVSLGFMPILWHYIDWKNNVKRREGDTDILQVGQQKMLKKGRVSPLSTLLPRVQECLGSVFEAQILELMKDDMLRISTKPLFQ